MKQHPPRTKYPLIGRAADAIGTSRITLWRALAGRYDHPHLVAGYRAFLDSHLNAFAPLPEQTAPPYGAQSFNHAPSAAIDPHATPLLSPPFQGSNAPAQPAPASPLANQP